MLRMYTLASNAVQIDFTTGILKKPARNFFEQVTLADVSSLLKHYKIYGDPETIKDDNTKNYPNAEVIVRYNTKMATFLTGDLL